jgi:hypothetical protein
MSDTTATTAAPPPIKLTASQVLQGIKDNFVVVSALAFIIGVTLATTFLASYLSVFDWHLILFIQYSVQESARGQEIILKDKTLSDVKVVLVMSRHTILLKDSSTLVVPTADIAQFKSALPLP